MKTQSTVWVIISCDSIALRLRNLIDGGQLSEVNRLSQTLESFAIKINRFVQARGGHLYVNLYERQIMELPLTVAKELPNIVAGYKEVFRTRDIPVGIGLTFEEAARALRVSRISRQIEMFDPEGVNFVRKSDFLLDNDILPPNLYDTDTTKPSLDTPPPEQKQIAGRPDIQTEMTNETNLINMISNQIGGTQVQQMQQQQQQQIEQAQQAQQQPRDLMEALHGEQLPGRDQQAGQEGQASDQEPQDGKKDTDESESSESEPNDKQVEKLYGLLANIQNKIPALMELHTKNPEAFKSSMALIQKLLNMTKTVSKKSEMFNDIEEIEKAIRAGLKRKWPVGTLIGRKRKVKIGNKEVWRDVSAGQVLDLNGQPVSVLSSNKQAEPQQNEVVKDE